MSKRLSKKSFRDWEAFLFLKDYKADRRAAAIAWMVMTMNSTSESRRLTVDEITDLLFPQYGVGKMLETVVPVYEWTEEDRTNFEKVMATVPANNVS